jgi:23S rRNA (pseudouridine1915-N3)-methyltransferase
VRIHICAVGRIKSGPESTLFNDYQTRFDRTGRGLGLGPLSVNEVEDRKGGGKSSEADLLRRSTPDGAFVIALDERGKTLSSPDFATLLASQRDAGTRDTALLIGGANGLDPTLVDDAKVTLSLGKMVWPHMLARVMIAEQLYRAASILAGAPYHRE